MGNLGTLHIKNQSVTLQRLKEKLEVINEKYLNNIFKITLSEHWQQINCEFESKPNEVEFYLVFYKPVYHFTETCFDYPHKYSGIYNQIGWWIEGVVMCLLHEEFGNLTYHTDEGLDVDEKFNFKKEHYLNYQTFKRRNNPYPLVNKILNLISEKQISSIQLLLDKEDIFKQQ